MDASSTGKGGQDPVLSGKGNGGGEFNPKEAGVQTPILTNRVLDYCRGIKINRPKTKTNHLDPRFKTGIFLPKKHEIHR